MQIASPFKWTGHQKARLLRVLPRALSRYLHGACDVHGAILRRKEVCTSGAPHTRVSATYGAV